MILERNIFKEAFWLKVVCTSARNICQEKHLFFFMQFLLLYISFLLHIFLGVLRFLFNFYCYIFVFFIVYIPTNFKFFIQFLLLYINFLLYIFQVIFNSMWFSVCFLGMTKNDFRLLQRNKSLTHFLFSKWISFFKM